MSTFLKLVAYVVSLWIIVISVVYIELMFNSDHLKEDCLKQGGTAVEFPQGNFERCIL